MTTAVAEKRMAKPEGKDEIAYQIRCKRTWMERVQKAASALGLTAAAYIRMVVTQRMDQDGIDPPKPPRKPTG